ncbi:MAG: M23 family metallopeptidase, partial [Hyphomicrobium sp.]
SVYDDGHIHRVTVARNSAGEFTASEAPPGVNIAARAAMAESDQPQSSSVYSSLYHATLTQNVPPESITQILRIHAYDTDFRRRIRAGDMVEFFFDMKDEAAATGPPGELLYTSVTVGGETSKFWRFRTPEGVDYYDEQGNNSKKFLMRRPVRSEDVRLTSGFGVRFHPLLNERKMHTGVDWAAPTGTPILAAGTGVIEEGGRKGYNGNYVRIRHANGYQTAYSHMSRIAPGVQQGIKIRQGQIIGYVGSTGLSSGPHLHYEVLVNSRFVDPLSIQVPRERQLSGKQLADFQKDRARIDELMRRAPVMQDNR